MTTKAKLLAAVPNSLDQSGSFTNLTGATGNFTSITASGLVYSTTTGFKFPDGSIQTLAATSAPALIIVSGTTQTAVKNNHYVLTNVATSTLTLPATPSDGDIVWVTVANGLTTNVMGANGKLIMGIAEDMIMDSPTINYIMRYLSSTLGWRMI